MGPNNLDSIECQIQAKNSNVSTFFTRSGLLHQYRLLNIFKFMLKVQIFLNTAEKLFASTVEKQKTKYVAIQFMPVFWIGCIVEASMKAAKIKRFLHF